MKRHLLIAALLPLLTAATALAHGGEEAATDAAPAPNSYTFSPSLAHATLLLVIWLTVAAIVLGPIAWFKLGDLWQRKTTQPFLDDSPHTNPLHSQSSATHH